MSGAERAGTTKATWPAAAVSLGFTQRQLACTALGAVAAGWLLTYTYAHRYFLQRDAPPGVKTTHLREHFASRVLTGIRRRLAKKRLAAAPDAPKATDALIDDDDAPVIIRPMTLDDAEAVALQMHVAFNEYNASVGLSYEFSSIEFSRWVVKDCIEHDLGLAAFERKPDGTEGEVLGSAWVQELDIEDGAVGCGPWSAKWGALNQGVGRRLFEELLAMSIRHGAKTIRLMQTCANQTSLSLYTSLGFVSREPVTEWAGLLSKEASDAALAEGAAHGLTVRAMSERDITACDRLHRDALGISREKSLTNDVRLQSYPTTVVLDAKRNIVGYNTGLSCVSYTLVAAQTNVPQETIFKFLLASVMVTRAAADPASYVHEPIPHVHTCSRLYPQIDRWLLQSGVRIHRALNQMVLGEWQPINHERFIYAPTITY